MNHVLENWNMVNDRLGVRWVYKDPDNLVLSGVFPLGGEWCYRAFLNDRNHELHQSQDWYRTPEDAIKAANEFIEKLKQEA